MTLREFQEKYDVPYPHIQQAMYSKKRRQIRNGNHPEAEILNRLLKWEKDRAEKYKARYDGHKEIYQRVIAVMRAEEEMRKAETWE